jgi:hypothetical protein
MFVYGGERRQAEAAPDFLQARCISMLLNELVQVIEDFALAFRKRKHVVPPSPRSGSAPVRRFRRDIKHRPFQWLRCRDYMRI